MNEKLLRTQIISPDKEIYDGDTEMVVLPGEDGDFAAMYEHAPLITFLRPGKVEIFFNEEKEKIDFFVSGGFVKIANNNCTVMVDHIKNTDDIDTKENEKKISELFSKVDKENDLIKKNKFLLDIELLKSEIQAKSET